MQRHHHGLSAVVMVEWHVLGLQPMFRKGFLGVPGWECQAWLSLSEFHPPAKLRKFMCNLQKRDGQQWCWWESEKWRHLPSRYLLALCTVHNPSLGR
jgi:hypothetical protein